LQNKTIERVERRSPAAGELAEGAAFGRAGIDVFQMAEIRRIVQVTEGRQAVSLGLAAALRCAPWNGSGGNGANAENQNVAPRKSTRADVAHSVLARHF